MVLLSIPSLIYNFFCSLFIAFTSHLSLYKVYLLTNHKSMINQFKATLTGNTVRDEVKFGTSSVQNRPYAAVKVAVNSFNKDNPATFLNIVTWNPKTIQWLKQYYKKGMLVNVEIESISSMTKRDDEGNFLSQEIFFNASRIYQILMPKLDNTAEVPDSIEENVIKEEETEEVNA